MLSVATALTAVAALLAPVVVDADDAVRPRPGKDYTLIATLHLPARSSVQHVTEDGRLVLVRERRPHLLLIHAETGRRTPLPSPGYAARVVDVDADVVWYVSEARRGGDVAIHRYDLASDQMRRSPLPDVGQGRNKSAHVLGPYGARWFFSVGPRREDPRPQDVWSFEPTSAMSAQREARRKTGPTLIEGHLTWGEGDRVALRDLATDEVERWPVPEGCTAGSGLRGGAAELVLDVRCDRPEGQTLVFDRTGTVTAILRVDADEGSYGTRDRGTFLADTFYDFTTGRLYDLRTPASSLRRPVSSDGDLPVQVWPQRERDLVVRLR